MKTIECFMYDAMVGTEPRSFFSYRDDLYPSNIRRYKVSVVVDCPEEATFKEIDAEWIAIFSDDGMHCVPLDDCVDDGRALVVSSVLVEVAEAKEAALELPVSLTSTEPNQEIVQLLSSLKLEDREIILGQFCGECHELRKKCGCEQF